MSPKPKAWLARSGRFGERETWALETDVTPGGFGEVADLSECQSREQILRLVAEAYPDKKPQAQANLAAQLWTLRDRMSVGDWVVLPLKSAPQLAVGHRRGPYEYRAEKTDPEKRHVRAVEWVRKDVPRSAVKQDLLYSLGAFSTYCQVKRNEAARRISTIAAAGRDPGTAGAARSPHSGLPGTLVIPDDLEGDDSPVNLDEFARDRITAIIHQEFAGHKMQELVAAVLRADGFTCRVATEGADGGVDILAGSGPLGMDAPRLVVQVKSEEGAVGDPVVNQLLGSISQHTPAQGLLVAWGGVTAAARRTVVNNYFQVRVWSADDLIDQITKHYRELPEEIRADLPLKQIWIAVEDEQ